MQNKILAFLSIAKKAGRISSGEFSVENAIKQKKAELVIIAKDASDNTKKHFNDMCRYRHIDYYIYGTKEELGACLGKEIRTSIAVTDKGFSENLKKLLMEVEN